MLISISGVVNAVLGAAIGAMFYEVYPGGWMGHVGIIAGIIAVVIGLLILFVVIPLYEQRKRLVIVLAGIFTIVLGHAGAVAGAIYVGTVGMVLCYVAGIWVLVAAARRTKTP
ncbi:MAG: hypothetical protein JSV97_02565 [candidate division WOR-3 bacterium]|nr:MAG: hypothetical protein JSV97_02565 [candidate division WOR-3 bacterium]